MNSQKTLVNNIEFFTQAGRIKNNLLKRSPKITQLDDEFCAWALQFMEPKQTFSNVLIMSQIDYSSLVIGYAILPNGNVIEHAWNADSNNIFDLTGQLFWSKSDFYNCIYLEGFRLDPIEAKIISMTSGIRHTELRHNPHYRHMFNQ
ncbi:hypothetical protein ABT56_19195 [Photobacterium aquae]|uniref:Uncharacterized protein n=1 Tax=Photobacterium aquae TaxID=1195763 RepID=A0A0J1GUZ7_9GAMM|nr:hypothetical protein [Photobacterium aquae]KLV03555.1 hypothetical protein ABT56_19195 [Photobacterium aquae]